MRVVYWEPQIGSNLGSNNSPQWWQLRSLTAERQKWAFKPLYGDQYHFMIIWQIKWPWQQTRPPAHFSPTENQIIFLKFVSSSRLRCENSRLGGGRLVTSSGQTLDCSDLTVTQHMVSRALVNWGYTKHEPPGPGYIKHNKLQRSPGECWSSEIY